VFIAIDLDETLRKGIEEAENKIKKTGCYAKLVEPENLHITVKFLGEVSESSVNGIENKISETISGVKQFQIGLEGVGFFGNPNHIRTIWIDFGEGKGQLVKLIENMNKNLDYIRREVHESNPHLTVGRVKSGVNKEKLLETIRSMKDVKFGQMPVKFVKLKQSVLTKQGPIYSDLKSFELE
jgi:2'-5' RNA ligase